MQTPGATIKCFSSVKSSKTKIKLRILTLLFSGLKGAKDQNTPYEMQYWDMYCSLLSKSMQIQDPRNRISLERKCPCSTHIIPNRSRVQSSCNSQPPVPNGNKPPAPRKDSNLHTSLINGNRSIEGQKQVDAPQKLACRIEKLKKLINKLRVSIWSLGPEDIDDKKNQEKYMHLVTYATDVDCGCQRLSCGWWYNPAMYSWLKQPASNCILAWLLFTHYVIMQHNLLECSLVGLPICFFSLTKMWTIMSRNLAASHSYYAQPLLYFSVTGLMGFYV